MSDMQVVHLIQDGTESWPTPLTACSGTPYVQSELRAGVRVRFCEACNRLVMRPPATAPLPDGERGWDRLSPERQERALRLLAEWDAQPAASETWPNGAPRISVECPNCEAELDLKPGQDGKWRVRIFSAQPAAQQAVPDGERRYPCDRCGKLRTEAEGGTTFTVCDKCWDILHRKSAPDGEPRWTGRTATYAEALGFDPATGKKRQPAAQYECRLCEDTRWVCEQHPDRPWSGMNLTPSACPDGCAGPGVACPLCHPHGQPSVGETWPNGAPRISVARPDCSIAYHPELDLFGKRDKLRTAATNYRNTVRDIERGFPRKLQPAQDALLRAALAAAEDKEKK